ncbi:MAG: DUF1572 family protein [Acidobacteriota bacterium]
MAEATTALGREASRQLGEYWRKIASCVALLSEDEVWWRANPACNSVGNLLLHLTGNLSQWLLAGLGGASYERHRAAEFAADRSRRRDDLLAGLGEVVERAQGVAERTAAADLVRRLTIQGMERDGFGVIFHAVEHMGYHTGQIVHITKELAAGRAEIDFYPHLKGR